MAIFDIDALPDIAVDGREIRGPALAEAAMKLVSELAGSGVVAVEAAASLDTVIAVVAGVVAGVPLVPLPPDAGPMERDHILSDSGAEVVVAGSMVRALPSTSGPAALPADVAMVMYTSGTTGKPKGVMLSSSAIETDLDLLSEAWGWTPDDVLVHGLPLFHVHGLVLGVLGALRKGSRLVHTGRPTPAAYAAAQGSLYFGVPTVWSRVAADTEAAEALRGARLLVSGSAGLPTPVFDRLATLAGQGPIERYGMTETLITVSGRADRPRRPGWVGWALPGVQTRVVGDDGAALPADGETIGELEVRGPTLMSGYLGRADDTRCLYRSGGWLRTGDVAIVDQEGWHRIVGRRATDLIKSGGYRIGAGEVEAALLAHQGVHEAAVVGVPDEDLGEAVVAYVVTEGVSASELIEFVASRLSVHKRPRRVEFVAQLPRNAMGKVQKGLLSEH